MNPPFIFMALLLIGLTIVLAFNSISAIATDQHLSEVKRQKKPGPRDQFPGDTQPGTAPGGAIDEDAGDKGDNA